jgi:hypothetical protein
MLLLAVLVSATFSLLLFTGIMPSKMNRGGVVQARPLRVEEIAKYCFPENQEKNSEVTQRFYGLIAEYCQERILGSVDMTSKLQALRGLQVFLEEAFKRKRQSFDEHGVANFVVNSNVESLEDSKLYSFGEFKISGQVLKQEAQSFKIYYLKELSNQGLIKFNFSDKTVGRTWQNIYNKHFTVATSYTTITHGPSSHAVSDITRMLAPACARMR